MSILVMSDSEIPFLELSAIVLKLSRNTDKPTLVPVLEIVQH